jgi:UTP--glucose-1-phosphate uridylyltransferase
LRVRKAVIPAAGLGTRFLTVSKSIPKELLPVLDKPLIQYAVEEAANAGIQHIIIVSGPRKPTLQSYFKIDSTLDSQIVGRPAQLIKELHNLLQSVEITFTVQHQPLGLGHAVLTAAPLVGEEPFLVLLPDDLIFHEKSGTQQLLDVFDNFGGSVIAVEEVPHKVINQYGVIQGIPVDDSVYRVENLIEKPEPSKAPSNLAIVGRYILSPNIFSCLRSTEPDPKGEIQLTDGIIRFLYGHTVYARRLSGIRYDAGSPAGLLKASIRAAMERADTREELLEFLYSLGFIMNQQHS